MVVLPSDSTVCPQSCFPTVAVVCKLVRDQPWYLPTCLQAGGHAAGSQCSRATDCAEAEYPPEEGQLEAIIR